MVIPFEQLCEIVLVGRMVEQTSNQVVRRGVVTKMQVCFTKGSFAKKSTKTLQLLTASFVYWDKENNTWTQTAPSKVTQLTQNHVALYTGSVASIEDNGIIRYGSVIIYPLDQVPATPTVT